MSSSNSLGLLIVAVLLALAAAMLIGSAAITILDVREEASIQGQANWDHCHQAKGTPEFKRFGCDTIEWGHFGQP